jgi:hypothetical protein
MATSTFTHRGESSSARTDPGSRGADGRPAATAATRISRASLALGGLGLASAIFVVVRLFETWRVGSIRGPHRIAIFGQSLTYPTANLDAIVIMLLAALGTIVTGLVISGAVRELAASRRFQCHLRSRHPRPLHGGALILDDEQPRAFCVGLLRPQVYVSSGAVAMLDDDALGAVLAHEHHHARRHDPLRLAVGRVLARALFFLPELDDLVERQQALAELSADESAVNTAPANRSALARAMLSFSDAAGEGTDRGSAGIDPARVDYLLGDPPSWRFPIVLCTAAGSMIALLATLTVLAGQLASGSATLALPFLSRQPCIVILAAIPAALGLSATGYRHRVRVRSARNARLSPSRPSA